MVKSISSLFFLLLCSVLIHASDVQIQVEIDSDLASEDQAIIGKVVVIHPEDKLVDENSFQLDQSPLDVQLLNQSMKSSITIFNGRRTESNQVVSYYTFEIPGQKKGRYKLGPISVQVGNATVKSKSIPYEIYGTQSHSGFTLENFFHNPKVVYPGQRFKVGYRLSLRTQIEVTREHFPLFDPPGFNKIGERNVSQYRRGNTHIYEFTQELEANKAGQFEIEESYIEGLAYQEDFFSRRVYKKPKLRARTEKFKIEIREFPIENQPSSFEGAIGRYEMQVQLLSSPKVCVGDKLELQITFKGEGLETLKLPHFSKQKDLKAHFRFSDLPPVGKQKGNSKVFHLELRALQDSVSEIPPLYFSYFDPSLEEYHTLKSEAIPIQIKPLPIEKISESKKSVEQEVSPLKEVKQQSLATPLVQEISPKLIDISGVFPLNSQEISIAQEPSLRGEFFLMLALLFIVQITLYTFLQRKKKQEPKSQHLLKEAFKYPHELQKYHDLLEKAFHLKLREKGGGQETSEKQVQNFLDQVQMELFSGCRTFNFKKSQKEAKKLFKLIGDLGS